LGIVEEKCNANSKVSPLVDFRHVLLTIEP